MRVHNFSAGPAALPVEVIQQIQEGLLNWHGIGYSVMELGHRSEAFKTILEETKANLKDLMDIPDDYRILFIAGGATVQFATIPMHFLAKEKVADYFDTGSWSKKAIKEAKKYGNVNSVTSSADNNYTSIPAESEWALTPDAAYCHYTGNETIHGVQFHRVPNVGDVPLVSDMTSCILSGPLDVSRFGLIYAGAQKNLGIAGLSLVIIREDLLEQTNDLVPSVLQYNQQAQANSLLNTPPTFAIYVMGKVLKWVKAQGGVNVMAELNQRKAGKIYEAIDADNFYNNPVEISSRSLMNPVFRLPTKELEASFIQEAHEADLVNLRGHRSVGGVRLSLYNAITEHSVDTAVDFMNHFAKTRG